MPWEKIELNDGSGASIPSIAFGTWTAGSGPIVTARVDTAFESGFDHIDTAQSYGNELETGVAIKLSDLKREQMFITTKFSGRKDVETSIKDSLNYLGVSYVDLYLVHSPRLANGDIPGLWAKMEKIKKDGLAKSIGVSNFSTNDLKTLLASAKIKPAVNQILFHPYVWEQQKDVHAFGLENGIITEAYSALTPVTRQPGGPLDKPLADLGKKYKATADQILLAWVKARGAVAVTYSSSVDRLDGYMEAGDIVLSDQDISLLENAGAKKCWLTAKTKKALAVVGLVGLVGGWYGLTSCSGMM